MLTNKNVEPPALTEAEAIQGSQAGDVSSFEVLYELHRRRVYSICLRMTGRVRLRTNRSYHRWRVDQSGSCGLPGHSFSRRPAVYRRQRRSLARLWNGEGWLRSLRSYARCRDFRQFPHVLTNTDPNGVFYPAGGVEAFAGIFGVRAEIGDEMYFDNGANHNLRITAGPVIRF